MAELTPSDYYDALPPKIRALWDQVYDPEPWPEDLPQVRIDAGAWDDEIATLEGCTDKYVQAELEVARANNGNPVFRPYLDRALKRMLNPTH